MALITCPECGAEISDKASACIHCGYPIQEQQKSNPDIFLTLFSSVSMQNNVENIYSQVAEEVYNIKSSKNEVEANDIISAKIIDGLKLKPSHYGFGDVNRFCSMIKFESLSPEAMKYFTEQLYEIVSTKHFYDDGSGGYCYITQFYYPLYMVLQYGSTTDKEKLMTILNTTSPLKNTWYEHVVSMYKQRGNQYIPSSGYNPQNKNGVKCPYCSSTNVKKISTLSKAGSLAFFGIFAIGKTTKEWHCNKCNSNF